MNPEPVNFSLQELHNIIDRENVIVVSAPTFSFDLVTMSTTFQGITRLSTVSETSEITLVVPTQKLNSLDELVWDDDTLYFFYTGTKLKLFSELKQDYVYRYDIRRAEIKKAFIRKAIDRYGAVKRLSTNFSLLSPVSIIREYVASEQFVIDKELASIPLNELGIEYAKSKVSPEIDSFLKLDFLPKYSDICSEEFIERNTPAEFQSSSLIDELKNDTL